MTLLWVFEPFSEDLKTPLRSCCLTQPPWRGPLLPASTGVFPHALCRLTHRSWRRAVLRGRGGPALAPVQGVALSSPVQGVVILTMFISIPEVQFQPSLAPVISSYLMHSYQMA